MINKNVYYNCPAMRDIDDRVWERELNGLTDHEGRSEFKRLFDASETCKACASDQPAASQECQYIRLAGVYITEVK